MKKTEKIANEKSISRGIVKEIESFGVTENQKIECSHDFKIILIYLSTI